MSAIGKLVFGAMISLLAVTAEAEEQYFPPQAFRDEQTWKDFPVEWYSRELDALEEPSLAAGNIKGEVYRFLWLRSFHPPFVFRLTIQANGTSELTIKKTDGAELRKLVMNKTIQIGATETKIFLSNLDQIYFWRLATNRGETGLDGAQWVIEGVKDGKYHVVSRWSGGALRIFALPLMHKSGEDLEPIY
jgi:hypothetical protein